MAMSDIPLFRTGSAPSYGKYDSVTAGKVTTRREMCSSFSAPSALERREACRSRSRPCWSSRISFARRLCLPYERQLHDEVNRPPKDERASRARSVRSTEEPRCYKERSSRRPEVSKWPPAQAQAMWRSVRFVLGLLNDRTAVVLLFSRAGHGRSSGLHRRVPTATSTRSDEGLARSFGSTQSSTGPVVASRVRGTPV